MSLINAAREGKTEEVRKLLGSNNINLNEADHEGKTALHYAVKYAGRYDTHLEILNLLLDARADANTQDNVGHTALYYAAENGWLKGVEALLPTANKEGLLASCDIVVDQLNNLRGDRDNILKLLMQKLEEERPEEDSQLPYKSAFLKNCVIVTVATLLIAFSIIFFPSITSIKEADRHLEKISNILQGFVVIGTIGATLAALYSIRSQYITRVEGEVRFPERDTHPRRIGVTRSIYVEIRILVMYP